MKISAIAPSNTIVGEKGKKIIDTALEKFKKNNIEIELGENVFSDDLFGYTTKNSNKIKDILVAFENDNVVLCVTGGINENTILDELDLNLLKEKRNVFIGNSNNTILLNVFAERTNIKCYLGANLKHYGKSDCEKTLDDFKEKIINKNKNVNLRNIRVINNGKVSGNTVGGNASALRRVAGTDFFPNVKNKILILEVDHTEIPPLELQSIFSQYKQMGIFDSINGLILGEYSDEMHIEDIVNEYIKGYNYPIIVSRDFGHILEPIMLPIGQKMEIDTYNSVYKEV